MSARKYPRDATCAIEDCGRPRSDREWCDKHYKRFQTHGDPLFTKQFDLKGKTCLECSRPARKVFLCNSHYSRKWRKDNPEKAAIVNRQAWYRRAVVKKGAEGSHTRQEWESLVEQYKGLCAYCSQNKATDRDHVVPLSRGGTDYIYNILPSCKSCNSSKHTKLIEEWSPAYGAQ